MNSAPQYSREDRPPGWWPGGFLAWLWLGVTLTYAGVLLHRTILQHRVPGLETVVSVAAVGAVWMLLAGMSPRPNLRVAATLLLVVVANLVLIVDALRRGQEFPLVRAGVTFLITLVIRHLLLQSMASRTSGRADHPPGRPQSTTDSEAHRS